MNEIIGYKMMRPWLWIPWIYVLTDMYKHESQALKTLHNMSSSVSTYKFDFSYKYFILNYVLKHNGFCKRRNKLAVLFLISKPKITIFSW